MSALRDGNILLTHTQLHLMAYWSLENDELLSPITSLLCSLIEPLRCLTTDGREIVCLRNCLCPLVPIRKRTRDPVQTVELCADFWHAWGKETDTFSSLSKSTWTDIPWASGRCVLQKHRERRGTDDCIGMESFQKPNVFIHSAFSFGTVFCLLFYDPLLSMRLVGIRCDFAPVDKNAWVFAHSHKQHNALIWAIWYGCSLKIIPALISNSISAWWLFWTLHGGWGMTQWIKLSKYEDTRFSL